MFTSLITTSVYMSIQLTSVWTVVFDDEDDDEKQMSLPKAT